MKKLFVFFMLVSMLFCAGKSLGQSYFTSSKNVFCMYNYSTSAYDNCRAYSNQAMFKISSDETSISFSTADGSSTYYVVDRKVDDTNKQWWYSVVYTDGTKYIMVFDLENSEVRLTEADGTNAPVSYFFITKMWNE